jgi:hypothetical protein
MSGHNPQGKVWHFPREDVAGSKEKCGMSRDGGVAGGKLGRGAKGRHGRPEGKAWQISREGVAGPRGRDGRP